MDTFRSCLSGHHLRGALGFCLCRTHSNNTAEMIAMIEALSFLGLRGLVTHDEQSRIFEESMHAAGM